MKVSVLSYSFRGLLGQGKIDVFGYLESCKYRYGLSAADIWNGFLTSTDEEYLRKVRDALDERELELADLCVDRAHVWDDDPELREANHRNALAHLRAAEILGARFVRIDAGSRRELRDFLSSPRVRLLTIGEETAERFAAVHQALRRAGTPIPTHDLWIAASAMEHGLRVLTADAHVGAVPMLLIERVGPE